MAHVFVAMLRAPGRPRVRRALEVGLAWQEEIYSSLERSPYVVALLSPDYLQSKACKDEFAMARLHGDWLKQRVLRPVYVFEAKLPARMLFVQYLDAREGDTSRVREAASAIAGLLGQS